MLTSVGLICLLYINIYAKEVLLGGGVSNLSSSGCSHVGLRITNEEQTKVFI